jgi:predicted transcriptional regulator
VVTWKRTGADCEPSDEDFAEVLAGADRLREDRARIQFVEAVLDGLEEADRGSTFTHDEVMRGLEARFVRR